MKIQKYLKPPPTVNFGEGSTPPKFNSEFTSEKWWLEDDPYLLGRELFRGYVKLRGGILCFCKLIHGNGKPH